MTEDVPTLGGRFVISVSEEIPRRGGESRRRKTKRKNSGRGEPSKAGILFMMDGSSLMMA